MKRFVKDKNKNLNFRNTIYFGKGKDFGHKQAFDKIVKEFLNSKPSRLNIKSNVNSSEYYSQVMEDLDLDYARRNQEAINKARKEGEEKK